VSSSGIDQQRAIAISIFLRYDLMQNNINSDLWEKELWTQQEVANYFRVVSGTVKNWRDQGLISFWRAPGSTRVLYYRDEIKDFREQNTINKKKGGDKLKAEIRRVKPCVLSLKKEWRI
jgi:hypothetical protein